MDVVQQEQIVWEGGPSQWMNLIEYVFLGVLGIFIIPLFVILFVWLKTINTKYRITTQRIIETTGILSKKLEEVEFYRVRDYSIEEPFYYRWFGISNIILTTSDKTHPHVYLRAIKNGEELRNKIRALVEDAKKIRKVSEIDIE